MPARRIGALMMAAVVLAGLTAGTAAAQPRKPNIVVIRGDDVDIAYVFNVRQDPYESYDQAPGPRATLTQQKTWLYNDVMARLARHMATLQKYPPQQKGTSLSVAN